MTKNLSEKNRLVENNVKFFFLIIQNFNLSKISNRYLATYVWTTNYAHSLTMPFPPGPTRINKRFPPQGEFLFRKKKTNHPHIVRNCCSYRKKVNKRCTTNIHALSWVALPKPQTSLPPRTPIIIIINYSGRFSAPHPSSSGVFFHI